MSTEEHFCKVETDSEDTYYLFTKWYETGRVKLCLSDGEKAWCGILTEATLKDSCKSLKMEFEKFMEETRKALTRENVGGLTFKYEVKGTGDDDEVTLVWKKFIPNDKIKIQLGKISLKEAEEQQSVMSVMFEHCIGAQSEYNEKLSSLASDNERLVAERASALKRLEKYVTVKEDLEQDLYSKFVLIINEKKAKIRSLRAELEDALSGVSEQSVQPSTSGTNRKNRAASSEPEDDNDISVKDEPDSEYDTDKEESSTVKPPPVKKSRGIKQEVVDTVDELLDDMIDGDDIKPEPAKGKRARGRRGRGGKQTPSKPVMPKVPSGDTPVQSSRRSRSSRTSLGKTPSDASNKSSENLDDLVSQI